MTDRQTSLPRLRTTAAAETAGAGGLALSSVAESVDLLVDLIGQTKLVPADKLARAAERARQTGSLSHALVQEGIATGEGIARRHATQFRLPLIDFVATEIDESAVLAVPMRVLERVVA